MQLSELALAAKSAAGEEERQEEETRRATEEAQRAEELVGLGIFRPTRGTAAEVSPFCLSLNIITDVFGKGSSIGFTRFVHPESRLVSKICCPPGRN